LPDQIHNVNLTVANAGNIRPLVVVAVDVFVVVAITTQKGYSPPEFPAWASCGSARGAGQVTGLLGGEGAHGAQLPKPP